MQNLQNSLEAQISPKNTCTLCEGVNVKKVAGRGTSDLNNAIYAPIHLNIIVKTVDAAIRLHQLGYISKETLDDAGVILMPLPDIGTMEHNQCQQKAIENAIESYFGYTRKELSVKSRKRELVFPRQISMYLLNKYTSYTLQAIIFMYGRSNHTTVIHSSKCIINFMGLPHGNEKETLDDFLSKYSFE